jgi:metal-dependent amidase/aminoacylase/carboxypeptidase family protein
MSTVQTFGQSELVYKDFHRHPELSCQESRTAEIAANHLKKLHEFSVREKIGGNGVVGVLENGPGSVVLLRAEMNALPVFEKTNLDYASKAHMKDTDGKDKPAMHACGYDLHMTCLIAAATLLYAAREEWNGTLIRVF